MNENNPKSGGKDSHYARLRRAHRAASPPSPADDHVVIYGLHSVKAAMENPDMRVDSRRGWLHKARRMQPGYSGGAQALGRFFPDAVKEGCPSG